MTDQAPRIQELRAARDRAWLKRNERRLRAVIWARKADDCDRA